MSAIEGGGRHDGGRRKPVKGKGGHRHHTQHFKAIGRTTARTHRIRGAFLVLPVLRPCGTSPVGWRRVVQRVAMTIVGIRWGRTRETSGRRGGVQTRAMGRIRRG